MILIFKFMTIESSHGVLSIVEEYGERQDLARARFNLRSIRALS